MASSLLYKVALGVSKKSFGTQLSDIETFLLTRSPSTIAHHDESIVDLNDVPE